MIAIGGAVRLMADRVPLPNREQAQRFEDAVTSVMDAPKREAKDALWYAFLSGRLVDREAIDRDQVPNWWIEHDAHAILGAKLGTIEAGWRYFCGLVDIALLEV